MQNMCFLLQTRFSVVIPAQGLKSRSYVLTLCYMIMSPKAYFHLQLLQNGGENLFSSCLKDLFWGCFLSVQKTEKTSYGHRPLLQVTASGRYFDVLTSNADSVLASVFAQIMLSRVCTDKDISTLQNILGMQGHRQKLNLNSSLPCDMVDFLPVILRDTVCQCLSPAFDLSSAQGGFSTTLVLFLRYSFHTHPLRGGISTEAFWDRYCFPKHGYSFKSAAAEQLTGLWAD